MDSARADRRSRPPGHRPAMAVAGDVDPAPLRAAGWVLRGALSTMPYADPLDAAPYSDVAELAADGRIDAVAVDGDDPSLARLLPELRAAGLLVLLPAPAPLDTALLRAALAVDPERDADRDSAVGLLQRWERWALTVAAALPLPGGPPLQVTVRGWPRGRTAAAELVDLVAGWCGEITAVVAAPAPLPAPRLPGGEPVAWSLLCASGATVLVSHAGEGPLVRLSFATARLEAGPAGARWEGGSPIDLLDLPAELPPAVRVAGPDAGRVGTAAALAAAAVPAAVEAARPRAADLGDLLVAARVLTALRESARAEGPVEVG